MKVTRSNIWRLSLIILIPISIGCYFLFTWVETLELARWQWAVMFISSLVIFGCGIKLIAEGFEDINREESAK